ncbi:uncharacterized protein [Rhodnius prolixus]
MSSERRLFDLNNEEDAARIHKMLFDHDSSEEEFDISSENSEDLLLERERNSDTEQSDAETEDENEIIGVGGSYIADINNIVNNYRLYKKPSTKRRNCGKQNIIVHIPGVKGAANKAESILQSWGCLIDDDMLNQIIVCTNVYIQTIENSFSRSRDAKLSESLVIKAFKGLLYLAGTYREARLN